MALGGRSGPVGGRSDDGTLGLLSAPAHRPRLFEAGEFYRDPRKGEWLSHWLKATFPTAEAVCGTARFRKALHDDRACSI